MSHYIKTGINRAHDGLTKFINKSSYEKVNI
jgi:hypothetical protein